MSSFDAIEKRFSVPSVSVENKLETVLRSNLSEIFQTSIQNGLQPQETLAVILNWISCEMSCVRIGAAEAVVPGGKEELGVSM